MHDLQTLNLINCEKVRTEADLIHTLDSKSMNLNRTLAWAYVFDIIIIVWRKNSSQNNIECCCWCVVLFVLFVCVLGYNYHHTSRDIAVYRTICLPFYSSHFSHFLSIYVFSSTMVGRLSFSSNAFFCCSNTFTKKIIKFQVLLFPRCKH